MPAEYIGETRWDVIERVWTLLWQMVVGYALAFLISFVVIVWTTLDLIWSFITNRDDLEADSTPAVWINAVLSWSISQTIYAFTGGADGEWIALPSSDTTM